MRCFYQPFEIFNENNLCVKPRPFLHHAAAILPTTHPDGVLLPIFVDFSMKESMCKTKTVLRHAAGILPTIHPDGVLLPIFVDFQ